MTTPAPSGLDLSFLNEEEARQIIHVLQRDTQLKRAEKERISKLYKKKQDALGLPGVTGEWFEDIQRRKFRNDTDVGTMLKQPLAHRLRKAIRNDSASVKPPVPQIPQAQKNGSPSILGGLRTPFVSLFSSFRKSKRQHPKPLQQQRQYPARYEHFVQTSKVETMAKTETCNSPLTPEPTNNRLDASQAEMVEDSMSTWNEQLENELLRVLGNLDDQLAREQAQSSPNRRTPIDYGSIAPDADQYHTITRQTFRGGPQRNDRSMFLSDGTRTLRAKDEHRTFGRPRMLYDTYIKRYHAEDYAPWDHYDRRSAALKRGHSTRSLRRSSEGSLGYSSGLHPSGFRHTGFPGTDTVNRSYSLSCLSRRQSLESADQLSPVGLPHPLATEGNRRFTPRNYHHHFKRTPLSSIVWNSPQSSKHPVYPDNLPRTQSLMEFGPTFEDTYPCYLQDNTRYQLYHSKVNYRRIVSNTNHSRRLNYTDRLTDPLCFDSRENYASPQLERKAWRPCYGYPSLQGRVNPPRNSFPYGRSEEQLFRPDGHQWNNDEVFLSSDANFERIPTNLNDWQSSYTKNIGLPQRESHVQSHASEYFRSVDHSEGISAKLFSRPAKSMQNCPMYNSTAAVPFVKASAANEPGIPVSKNETEHALQRQNLFPGTGNHPKPLVAQSKQNFRTLASEDGRSTDPSGIVVSGDTEGRTLQHIRQLMDTNSPSQVSPPKNASVALPQTSASLKPPFLGCSERQAELASVKEIDKMYFSNIGDRNRQQNTISNSVNQTTPQFPGSITKASVLQCLQQEGHQSESLGTFTYNKKNENIYSFDFDGGLEVLAGDQLPNPCTDKFSKQNSFVRHATSKSVSGCTNQSPSKSPTAYYTLPRKSASIDGSVISEKPISSPKRLFKNKITMGDNSDTLLLHRIENIHSDQDKFSFEDPARSSLLKNEENVPLTKDYHLMTTQDPNHRRATDTIVSDSENRAVVCCPEKTDGSVLSHSEETEAGNPLKQYKTTSTLTVSIEEDNVQYHELISVYYTLPRKQSRSLCNFFLDDSKNAGSSPPSEKSEGPPKKYDIHVGIASIVFPSSLQKEEEADPPGKMPATSGMPQNSKTAEDADKESFCVVSPIVEKGSSQSQSTVRNRKEALGPQTEGPAFNQSSGEVLHGPVTDPNPRVMLDKSVNIIASALGKLHVGTCPSPWKERSKLDTPLSLGSSNSTETKISLENVAATSSALSAKAPQKESPLWCQPSTDTTASNRLHFLPSHSIGNNQEGKYAANPPIGSPIHSSEDKTNQERARYICHIISKKGSGLQPRNQSTGSGTDEASVSETKVHSDFENQTLPIKAASTTVNAALQRNFPDKSGLEYPKTAQEETPKNSAIYERYANLERSMRNSGDNPNLTNSKDQLPDTKQDVSNCSATKNKPLLDCMKDNASDIEKRKNRASIKNKLAAMYKTSRKFSAKKSTSSKPHISNIFSQNDAPSLETSEPHSMLISSNVPQVLVQAGNENQNQNSSPERIDGTVLEQSKNKKLQTNESPPLVTNENRRPFTNLCNQKRETCRPSDKKVGNNLQNLTTIFPKETITALGNNFQAYDKSLENSNQCIFSRITAGDLSQKRKQVKSVGESSFSPLSSDNSSILIKNYSKATICPPQKVISTTEYVHDENVEQSSRLRNLNVPCGGPIINPGKMPRERHFSERSYVQEPHDSPASGSNLIQHNSRYSRKFKSYSELLSCDENENWEGCNDSNRTFGSRRTMYPSIDFGIFGKEQQQAFLDNVKRSLTEGRLWRPCLLKNPGFLRKEEGCSLNASELLSSSSTEKNTSVEDSPPTEPADIHGEDPENCSNSDSDTTTDDEYYLDEDDKESEL
ncbi:exophilin-5 [Tiliqua scincoides]|uniref:exophilin-5 n=1 Tax=Tiliqua scincoides TaxID=71010 RepID=UPI003461D36C